jgi:hypothetical protein
MPDLTVVGSAVKNPPYPDDLRARSYSPIFDLQRIRQSSTWLSASPEVRPWLVLLWLLSWESIPAGTYPADDAVIIARLGCQPEFFKMYRDQLMRGWYRCTDGRLYHPVITEQVLEMLRTRRYATERQKRWREEAKAVDSAPSPVPNVSRVTSPKSRVSNALFTVSHTAEQEQEQEQEKTLGLRPSSTAVDGKAEIPVAKVIELYHSTLPKWQSVKVLNDARRRAIRARWGDLPSLEHWKAFFERVAKSPFLQNKTDAVFRNDNLDFLLRPVNLAKIVEGHFDPRR